MTKRSRLAGALALLVWIAGPAAAQPMPGRRPAVAPDTIARVKGLAPKVERNLTQNVIPFWFPRSIDREHGGFIVHYGPKGEPLDGGVKMIVTQARQLWLASALLRTKYATPALREAADHGYRFLHDVMWDKANGGFVWEVDRTGTQVRRAQKHLYGQAFGVYAIAEYAIATNRRDALAFALEAFRLIDARAHDARYGGYREYFAADWSPAPEGDVPPLGVPAGLKLMNTHLHLLEAWTTLLRASGDPVVRERLLELVNIETHAVVGDGWTAQTHRHHADRKPIHPSGGARGY